MSSTQRVKCGIVSHKRFTPHEHRVVNSFCVQLSILTHVIENNNWQLIPKFSVKIFQVVVLCINSCLSYFHVLLYVNKQFYFSHKTSTLRIHNIPLAS